MHIDDRFGGNFVEANSENDAVVRNIHSQSLLLITRGLARVPDYLKINAFNFIIIITLHILLISVI